MLIISTKINKTNNYLPPKNKKTIKYIERNPLTEDIHTYVAGFNHLMGSLFNYFNNIVPISIEYILFGCNVISEELNTLLFKSVQKFIRQTCRFNNYYPQP